MAIISRPFGPTVLSGEDAEAFLRQTGLIEQCPKCKHVLPKPRKGSLLRPKCKYCERRRDPGQTSN